jgi:hypothetical protein
MQEPWKASKRIVECFSSLFVKAILFCSIIHMSNAYMTGNIARESNRDLSRDLILFFRETLRIVIIPLAIIVRRTIRKRIPFREYPEKRISRDSLFFLRHVKENCQVGGWLGHRNASAKEQSLSTNYVTARFRASKYDECPERAWTRDAHGYFGRKIYRFGETASFM